MFRILVIVLASIASASLFARPVSYPGGWTLMSMNDGDRYSTHVHYSPTAKYSLGYRAEYWREFDFQVHALQLNQLLKRWNKKHSQANLYLKTGVGLTNPDHPGDVEPLGFAVLAADWETRRYFVSYEGRLTASPDVSENFRHKARLGVAPYIADFGQVHSWIMLEARHAPESRNEFVITPLLRFFKGPSMLETGYSSSGKILFNFIYRF